MLAISFLLFGISENWWFSSALTYAPRFPFLIPVVVLLITSLIWNRAATTVNVISLAMVSMPIMGLSLPIARWMQGTKATQGHALKIVSCNVQQFKPDFPAVLAELGRMNPDVIAFQDARGQSRLLDQYFESWNTLRDGEFFVASKFPIKLVTIAHFQAFDRDAVMQAEIELPNSKINLFNIHQMTPRHGLRALDISSPITQRGSGRMTHYLQLRGEEADEVRAFIEQSRGQTPTLVVGDFNMPCESSLYTKHWQNFQNAFNTCGIGYGYSFPCTQQYCWPAGYPWMRLDHILADENWTIHSCRVGTANGSDHRLITATVELNQ